MTNLFKSCVIHQIWGGYDVYEVVSSLVHLHLFTFAL